jgi:ParB/RepB/Spo0J family partition protein
MAADTPKTPKDNEQALPKEHMAALIPTKLIKSNRFAVHEFDTEISESDRELYENVKVRNKVETPIQVRPIEEDEEEHLYEVYDGSRRLAAAKKAKIAAIHCLIEAKTDNEMIELGLVSDIRRTHDAIQQGHWIFKLLNDFPLEYPTKAKVARRLTKSEARIKQLINLVTVVDKRVQKKVAPADPKTKRIPEGFIDDRLATEIGMIEDKDRQWELTDEILAHPELTWNERRTSVADARENPEATPSEIVERRIKHHKEQHPKFTMSAKDYEELQAGKKKAIVELKLRPGMREDTVIDPLIKMDATLKLADVFPRPLGRFKEMDMEALGYSSLEEFKADWIKKHEVWRDEQIVYIYRFKSD